MRVTYLLPRFLALFVALCLALPGPALALRNLEPVESGLEEQIARRLGLPAAGPQGQASDPSKVLLPRHEGEMKALQWMKRMTQEKRPYLFVVGDVDWLGMLNKVYSKKIVNPVLTLVFEILQEEVRKQGGLIYRHGGDEFVFLVPLTRPRRGDADAKKAVEEGKEKARQIREAVAQQLLHRYVVVQSRASRAEVPKGFRSRVRARSRYAGTTYFLLEVPQGRRGRRLNPLRYAGSIQRAARAQGLSGLRPVELFGNESQFGFVNTHGKEFPVTVSLGGEVVLPSRGRVRKEEVSHGNLLKLHRRLLFDAEDWQKEAKVLFPWKNVEAVGVSLGAKKHTHDEGQLLNRPPTIGNRPLLLQYYTHKKIEQEVKQDLANGRSGILLQLVARYHWNGPLALKYRDGSFARFKAINEFLGYGAGDDEIKLHLAEAIKEFRAFPGFKVTVARAPPTESPDMVWIWSSWAGDQRAPGPSEGKQWSELRSAMVGRIGKVRYGINRTLKEKTLPALSDLGLQVTLDWAAAVADMDRDPEAERIFERLQSAMMVMIDRRHQAPNESIHGFLLHPLAGNASLVERSTVSVERIHRRTALAEAKGSVSPQRLRAARPEEVPEEHGIPRGQIQELLDDEEVQSRGWEEVHLNQLQEILGTVLDEGERLLGEPVGFDLIRLGHNPAEPSTFSLVRDGNTAVLALNLAGKLDAQQSVHYAPYHLRHELGEAIVSRPRAGWVDLSKEASLIASGFAGHPHLKGPRLQAQLSDPRTALGLLAAGGRRGQEARIGDVAVDKVALLLAGPKGQSELTDRLLEYGIEIAQAIRDALRGPGEKDVERMVGWIANLARFEAVLRGIDREDTRQWAGRISAIAQQVFGLLAQVRRQPGGLPEQLIPDQEMYRVLVEQYVKLFQGIQVRKQAGLEEEKDLGTLDYGREMLDVLMGEVYRAADDAVGAEGVRALEVYLLNETTTVSRRAPLRLDLGAEANPANWHADILHAMEEAGIGFGYWAVRAQRWTAPGHQPAISFFFQPAASPKRAGLEEPNPPQRPGDFGRRQGYGLLPSIGGIVPYRVKPGDEILPKAEYETPWRTPLTPDQVKPGMEIAARQLQTQPVALNDLGRFALGDLTFRIVPMAQKFLLQVWLGEGREVSEEEWEKGSLEMIPLDEGMSIVIGRERLPDSLNPLTEIDLEGTVGRPVSDARYRALFRGFDDEGSDDDRTEIRVAISYYKNGLNKVAYLPRQALTNSVSRGDMRTMRRPGKDMSTGGFLPGYKQPGHTRVALVGDEVVFSDLGSTAGSRFEVRGAQVEALTAQTVGSFRERWASGETQTGEFSISQTIVGSRQKGPNPNRGMRFPYEVPFRISLKGDGQEWAVMEFKVEDGPKEGRFYSRKPPRRQWNRRKSNGYVSQEAVPVAAQARFGEEASRVKESYEVSYDPASGEIIVLNYSAYEMEVVPLEETGGSAPAAGLEENPYRLRIPEVVDQFTLVRSGDAALTQRAGYLLEGEGLIFSPVFALSELRTGSRPLFAGVVESRQELEALIQIFAAVPEIHDLLRERLVVAEEQPAKSDGEKYASALAEAKRKLLAVADTVIPVTEREPDLLAQLVRYLEGVGYHLPDDPAARDAALTLLRAA